jgi:mono/diheme cytochrome c family protein
MRIRVVTMWVAAAAFTLALTFAAAVAPAAHQAAAGQGSAAGGWDLPPNADDEKNPKPVTPIVLNAGKALFRKNCERCHGDEGKGDGPDADPEHMEDMDLTNPRRVDRNSDGVVFYKVWNGRKKPKMPAFKDELTKDQVWSVVAFTQTLRKPAK